MRNCLSAQRSRSRSIRDGVAIADEGSTVENAITRNASVGQSFSDGDKDLGQLWAAVSKAPSLCEGVERKALAVHRSKKVVTMRRRISTEKDTKPPAHRRGDLEAESTVSVSIAQIKGTAPEFHDASGEACGLSMVVERRVPTTLTVENTLTSTRISSYHDGWR